MKKVKEGRKEGSEERNDRRKEVKEGSEGRKDGRTEKKERRKGPDGEKENSRFLFGYQRQVFKCQRGKEGRRDGNNGRKEEKKECPVKNRAILNGTCL